MKTKQSNETNPVRAGRQKKFLLWLPAIFFPLLTLVCWSAGIVGSRGATAAPAGHTGLNTSLPKGLPSPDSNWNKLQFYQQAEKDSARRMAFQKLDPAFPGASGTGENGTDSHRVKTVPGTAPNDTRAESLARKLGALNARLEKAQQQPAMNYPETYGTRQMALADRAGMERLESIAGTIRQKDTARDPELAQLDGMLDKVLALQHPEQNTLSRQGQPAISTAQVFPVSRQGNKLPVSLLESDSPDTGVYSFPHRGETGFYGLDEGTDLPAETQNAIPAEVPEAQMLVSGAVVRLRLSASVLVHGVLVPQGQPLFGIASLNGERLNINVTGLRSADRILPVSLSAYDLDGLPGLYVPGTITGDVAKQSLGQGVQGFGSVSLDPSLAAQAASVGIQTARSLIGTKIKLVKVTVGAGYRVLLRDNNSRKEKN